MTYCSESDVSLRLGLDNAQRDRASTRLVSAIRRSGIVIDQMFRDYGRDVPSDHTAETTLNGAISAGATTITLTSAAAFATSGNGSIDGDSFKWSGKSSNDLTGVTGVSYNHASGVIVQQGEMAHVLREICGDLAASIYLEDEAAFHSAGSDPVRSNVLRTRAEMSLTRLAHLGSVD
tara:strand:- start:185 stop:715 length:531 start_codon:yes stop_codon:yes gene_type:complete